MNMTSVIGTVAAIRPKKRGFHAFSLILVFYILLGNKLRDLLLHMPKNMQLVRGIVRCLHVQDVTVCCIVRWYHDKDVCVYGIVRWNHVKGVSVSGRVRWDHVKDVTVCGIVRWDHVKDVTVCGIVRWNYVKDVLCVA